MSCVHYQQSNPSKERSYFDGQYSNRYNLPPQYTPRSDNYRNGRGEPSYGDTRLQAGRTAPTYKQETAKHGDATMMEKIQTKMKFLEDSNIVMQTRNQNLITENKALTAQLKEERNEIKRLEKRLTLLREELDFERSKIEEMKKEAEDGKRQMSMGRNTETSTTNIIHKADRGVQVWAVCMGCQRKLESCEKQPPTVTITKSELEVLEKDMQTLRDTIIAREEAWDKAMEREHNYRQQLTRLTTETITARHLSETRNEELKVATNTLLEKESELKSLQKDNLYLNKLIAKLYNYQRGQEGCQRNILAAELNEKDQRFIEEIIRRINGKSKQKPKSKSCCSEKTAHCCSHQSTPREKTSRSAKDQTGYTKEIKR
ncbi:uncharacterized protein LOC100576779 [Apis mellifera]|uniref:Uncharacterized protein LOC100576779 n=1 Tax=Apis mellifera TaxID=7460 RepID=A0A7M7MVR4_APIME|nr:uncharacterized protein LOC100576779 [Apis mellifera]|eukprot:XP_026301689.1 uncharacterized protein LOC100576779 [Apis mellifera]